MQYLTSCPVVVTRDAINLRYHNMEKVETCLVFLWLLPQLQFVSLHFHGNLSQCIQHISMSSAYRYSLTLLHLSLMHEIQVYEGSRAPGIQMYVLYRPFLRNIMFRDA